MAYAEDLRMMAQGCISICPTTAARLRITTSRLTPGRQIELTTDHYSFEARNGRHGSYSVQSCARGPPIVGVHFKSICGRGGPLYLVGFTGVGTGRLRPPGVAC